MFLKARSKMKFRTMLLTLFLTVAIAKSEYATQAANTTASNKTEHQDGVEDDDSMFLAREQRRLIAHLFKNYDRNVRPVEDASKNISIIITPSVRQIVEINERQQVLTLYLWLRVRWYDKNFLWNKTAFSNISKVNVEPDSIWLPDLSLVNSAQEGQDALIYRKMKTKVQVHNDGLCKWLSPYFSSTSCYIDSTYFPFDEQVCEVEMGSWTATGRTIDVNLGELNIDLSNFLKNIQWKLVSATGRKQIKIYKTNDAPYPSLIFKFVLRRRSLFYIINLILPCVILSFLSLMTFYIPAASGERITLSISLLLTMLFTLYIVTENLPPDSTTVPLLTKFIGVAMLIMTLSLFATSVAIKFEGRAELMPKWLSLVVNKYLGCLVLHNTSWLQTCFRRRKNRGEVVLDDSSPGDNQETLLHDYGDDVSPQPGNQTGRDQKNQQTTCRHRAPGGSCNGTREENKTPGPASSRGGNPIMAEIARMFRSLASHVEKKNVAEEQEAEWREAGDILNKLFFWTFLAVLLFSTIAIFSNSEYTE